MTEEALRKTPVPATDSAALSDTEVTTIECRGCGALVSGLNNRYSCTVCGWVNHWSEGSKELPTAEDDPDWDGA